MVRAFDRARSRSSSFNFRKIFDKLHHHHHHHHHSPDTTTAKSKTFDRSSSMEAQPVTSPSIASPNKGPVSRLNKDGKGHPSDIDLMKERFAKLLLGEDMSGGGKGVSSALALSNAITNLAASIFGETKRLEPMPAERKARWRKEVDWLLSVTDHIVELVPSQQAAADGSIMEVSKTFPTLLLCCLKVDFKDANEAEKATGQRDNDKWWIPTVKIPPGGLSDITKKWIESLPKNGRASLGDIIYKCITDEYFDPDSLLSVIDLTSDHNILDLKNRIEASIVIWKRKMNQKDGKSSWSSVVSIEKRELFEERAETMLLILKHNFPGLPQSSLDISKIQYNKDVGHAVLESYSRVLESLAAAILNRIDDVIYADNIASESSQNASCGMVSPPQFDMDKPGSPSMTLSDFMGWNNDQGEERKNSSKFEFHLKEYENDKCMAKTAPEQKKISYLERLEQWGGLRSPTARH